MTATVGQGARPSSDQRMTFVDPASPDFWVMAILIPIGGIILLATYAEWLTRDIGATALAAVAWAVYGAIAVAIVIALQRYGHRSAITVTAALLWGGLAALGFAVVGNTALQDLLTKTVGSDFASIWRAPVSTPLVEESLKAVGILGLALIPGVRLRGPLDGLFYGVLIGAGFQVGEDFFYTIQAVQGDPVSTTLAMLVMRGLVVGLFSHAVYSGIIGASIGYFVSRRQVAVPRRIVPVVAAFVFVLILHGLWNLQGGLTAASIVLGIVPFVILIALLVWARRDEARRLAGLASIAVDQGVMTPDEVVALRADRRVTGREAKRRRLAQMRYLVAVDRLGPDSARATELAAGIPSPAASAAEAATG